MTNRRHILVVDDDPDLRVALHHSLVAEGYGVTEAASAAEAAQAVARRSRRFDLIILAACRS